MFGLKWLVGGMKEALNENSLPRFKIIHNPDRGYLPLVYDDVTEVYWAIKDDLTTGASEERATGYIWWSIWCHTEEEAGRRVDKYSQNQGNKTVWTSE